MTIETEGQDNENDLAQISVRIRKDQKSRLDGEQRARGSRFAEVVRDNLDLAFAMKVELAKIIEGEYEENNPANAPRLIHSLLFRVEERILAGLDRLASDLIARMEVPTRVGASAADSNASLAGKATNQAEIISQFISIISEDTDLSLETWLGAFLEIVPRIDLVGIQQLRELEEKGRRWMNENNS